MKPKNDTKIHDFYFEILVTDTTGRVVIDNENSFCHNLLSNSKLL